MGNKKLSGVGDAVAKVTSFFGIQPCEACNKRKDQLNNKWPVRLKPRTMTNEELTEWRHFQKIRELKLTEDQKKWICKIYSDVFQVSYFEPVDTSNLSPYLRMIERMDKEEETYKD